MTRKQPPLPAVPDLDWHLFKEGYTCFLAATILYKPLSGKTSLLQLSSYHSMIKAIIIDDEPLARSLVKEYLASYTDIEVMAECNDGFEGIKAIQEHQPDLLFLDIQMPKINGFEMLELLDQPPAVIFTTAFDEYAIRAFDNHAVDYLLKPFS